MKPAAVIAGLALITLYGLNRAIQSLDCCPHADLDDEGEIRHDC